MIILGISCFYHDSAACIVKDGQIIAAAAEERFTRKKHDNDFPKSAITYCLNELRIAMNEIDFVVFYEKPIIKFERLLSQHIEHFPKSYKAFIDVSESWISKKLQIKRVLKEECHFHGKILYLNHHLSHAASSFFISPFKKAAIVTLDGVGEWETTTMGKAENKSIKLDKRIIFPHSLGLLYSAITAFLGFKVNNDEYKVMGLASYGKPDKFRRKLSLLINLFKDGSYQLNMKYFDYTWRERMYANSLEKLFGFSARKAETKIEKHHADLAAALQEVLEKAIFNILNRTYKEYKLDNLCLSGGVALNSVCSQWENTKTHTL